MPRLLYLCLFLSIFSLPLFAQTGDIKGFVYDKNTGEPSIFTTVRLVGTNKGVSTDLNGYYSITKIPAGKYTLSVSFIGYDTLYYEFELKPGEKLQKNHYLNPAVLETKVINVTAEQTRKETRVEVSKVSLTVRELEKIPTIGGQADLAQYLQILPGVVSTGDQGGQLYIRGGTPIQNKVLLDGMTIYNPFHSIGLFSVFDVDIIKNVDVYTGGFSSEYGGRIGAIMDVSTRDGNKDAVRGKINIGTIASKISLEGPLGKFKEGESNASFIVSAKSSYLDKTSPILYKYADKNGLPYSFNDLYAKVTYNNSGGSKVSLFGFNFADNVDFTNSTKYNWNNYGAGTKFILLPPNSSTVIDGNFSYSGYQTTQTESDGNPRFSQINGFDGGMNFNQYPGRDHIKYGFQVLGFQTDYQFTNLSNRLIQQNNFTTEIAGYFRYNLVLGKLVIDPNIRIHYYATLGEFSPEPRMGIKYNFSKKLRFKAAGGLYSQNLISAQSDRDVVNLFYGFLSGSDNLPKTFNGQSVSTSLQKAQHYVAGFDYDIMYHINLSVEGYLKNYTSLSSVNRNKIFDNTLEFQDKPENLRTDYIRETGKAYGLDLRLLYDKSPFYFYAAYSLAYVERFDGVQTYKPHWDRRHNMNLVASADLGKKKSWQLNVRWAYGTGFPFTKTQGFYEQLDFQQGLATNYTNQNGTLGILYGNQNDGRLSDYHRLDISIQKNFKINTHQKVGINASCSNVYNRHNVFYFDRVKYVRVNQLPFIPSMSINYTF